jgi:6-phospho-beta-glucosidase
MQSLPAHYFQYFYFKDEILAELKAKPTTRSQDILAEVPAYYAHYREQANKRGISILEPRLSRGGLLELELAVAVLASVLNDRREIWPVNVPNNGAISDFADDLVVEVPAYVDKNGATPLVSGKMPGPVVGLVHMLAQYQRLTADAAWSGNRSDAIQALASHPLVFSLEKAEAIYDEMSTALQSLLPARLLQD